MNTPPGSKVEKLIVSLHSAYLNNWVERGPETIEMIKSLLHPQVGGFGTGMHEVFYGIEDIVNAIKKEHKEMPQTPKISIKWIKTQMFGDFGVSWSQFNVKLPAEFQFFEFKNTRMTINWAKGGDGWKAVHVHVSIPYIFQEVGESFPIEELKTRNLELEKLVTEKTESLKREKEKTESLLYNILPFETAKELIETGRTEPARFEEVTILFSDFIEFTNIVASIPTKKLIYELNEIFSKFDDIMDEEGIEKIKTLGDGYLAACGLPKEVPDHAIKCIKAGKKMMEFLRQRNEENAIKWKLRIGIHSGPIAAGVVGKRKFVYDIFGDTINIASRIETAGEEGKINISAYTYDLIRNHYPCEYRGKVSTKGKGDLDMYFVK